MAIGEDLDLKKLMDQMAKLPPAGRYGVLGGLFVLVLGLYWLTLYGGKQTELRAAQSQLAQVEQEIQSAKSVASNLESFKRQREELQAELNSALRKLPNASELPVLLTDMTSLGKKSGLEIRTFRPQTEITRGFFAEVPIQLEFYGRYHDVGVFFDRLSRLPRIVNITDLAMVTADDRQESPRLKVTGVATTFRFVEEAPQTVGGE